MSNCLQETCASVWSYKVIAFSSILICPHLPYTSGEIRGLSCTYFPATSKRQGSEQPPRLICQNGANSYSSSPNTCPWEHSRLSNQPWAYTAWGEAWTWLLPFKNSLSFQAYSSDPTDFAWLCRVWTKSPNFTQASASTWNRNLSATQQLRPRAGPHFLVVGQRCSMELE